MLVKLLLFNIFCDHWVQWISQLMRYSGVDHRRQFVLTFLLGEKNMLGHIINLEDRFNTVILLVHFNLKLDKLSFISKFEEVNLLVENFRTCFQDLVQASLINFISVNYLLTFWVKRGESAKMFLGHQKHLTFMVGFFNFCNCFVKKFIL